MGETGALRVRMGLHTGDAEPQAGDYYGTAVNKAARVMSLASGGQILLSEITALLLREQPPPDLDVRSLGLYRLKGLSGKTGLFQCSGLDAI